MIPAHALDLLKDFRGNRPASGTDLEGAASIFGGALPVAYRSFLEVMDGGEGPVGESGYAMLWRASELHRFNKEYEVETYAPGLILFGSDGGGEAFAFDAPHRRIVQVPFVGLDRALAEELSDDFWGFLVAIGRA